jgi:ATP-binding cassette subfamily F protein 3
VTLARDITFTLRRGEALGVIGPNGSGKTTFVKTVLGKLQPLAGELRWGTKVQIGYYAQQLDDLDERNEIIMELRRVAPLTATAGELRGFLAKFLSRATMFINTCAICRAARKAASCSPS